MADMTQAITLNPNYANVFYDRGIVIYDKRNYDGSVAASDPIAGRGPNYLVAVKPRGGYEYRREGDRIIRDAAPAVKIKQPESERMAGN